MKSLAVLGFLLATLGALANGDLSPASPKKDATLEEEKAAILDVIEQQAAAFWAGGSNHEDLSRSDG
jgi:hypothetical protein